MKKTPFLAIMSLFLVSCAAAPPMYTQSNINSASSREDQIALYQSLGAELKANPKSANAATYRQLMTNLGAKMGKEEAGTIREQLRNNQTSLGLDSLSALNEAQAEAEPIRIWSGAEYTTLMDELRQSRLTSETALTEQQARFSTLNGSSDLVPRVETLGLIRDLYGDNKEAQEAYTMAYSHARDSLSSAAGQAMRSGDFQSALSSYKQLKRLDPDFPQINQLVADAQSGMESSDFRQLLADGDAESAYTAFLRLSERPMTPIQKAEFVGPASDLAQYFANTADDMVRSGQFVAAYLLINREKTIRSWTFEPSRLRDSTLSGFTDAMFDRALASNAQDLFGLEYGYLLLVEEFDPYFVTLEEVKRESAERVYEDAIRRVGFGSITSAEASDQPIASQISSGVRQYLMVHIPEDVKIVERDMLEDIKRERQMSGDSNDRSEQNIELVSADYLIAGDLLTADVTEEVKQVKSLKRVVTGQKEVPNPAFTAWVKEKGKRKADHPDAPAKTIMEDVEEDITLNIAEHRKFGEVGVTYRVIDTTSAELKHSESVSRNMKVSDQAIEGVQMGDFVQEAKLAELPSNVEITNELVAQVVEAMAGDLVEFLDNPDSDYFKNCQQLAGESQYLEAAGQCANAAVLRNFKSQDNSEVVMWLKEVTLNSGMRAD